MSYESHRAVFDQPDVLESKVEPRPSLAARLAMKVRLWRERSAVRRYLGDMDARSLRDAGISPAAAAYESGKPFWRPLGPLR
jgi:uncharacterized protein YjiS (DUF1127 family)